MRILIVEDEPKTAAYVSKGLTEHAYVVDIDPGNLASQKVARRLGSYVMQAGVMVMPPPYHELPIDIWGQTRAEWLARRAAR